MNKKGFTLVELLATITILGIISLVAIPNIISVVEKNKRNAYVEDAKKLVGLAEYKFRGSPDEIVRPTGTASTCIRMSYLDTTDLSNPPEGGKYDGNLSYVKITRNNNEYIYSVQIVETYKTNKQRGIRIIDYSKLSENNANMKYVYTSGFSSVSCTTTY